MRAAVLAVLMLAIQVTGVSAQAAPSPSELSDEALATALLQIAASSHTRIGFESVEYIRSGVVRNHPGQEDESRRMPTVGQRTGCASFFAVVSMLDAHKQRLRGRHDQWFRLTDA